MMMGCTRKHREKNDKKVKNLRYLLDIDLKNDAMRFGWDGGFYLG